jgi:protein SCO1
MIAAILLGGPLRRPAAPLRMADPRLVLDTNLRTPLAVILTAAVLGLLALLAGGCSGSGGSNGTSASTTTAKFAGTAAKPPKSAPGLPLKDYLGNSLTASSLRGKTVLVTFIYTHCPDVCPLIVSHLHAAQDRLGAEVKKLQIIAVSVDPRGDTPKTVAAFLKVHQMTGRMRYLIGSRPQLERVWRAWNIISKNAPKKSKTPDLVEHSALIYGINGSGKISTLYPANFAPQQIVHDVPLLAAQ